MDIVEARKLLKPQYETLYGWSDIRVSECLPTYGGYLVAVSGPEKVDHEEIAFVYPDISKDQ